MMIFLIISIILVGILLFAYKLGILNRIFYKVNNIIFYYKMKSDLYKSKIFYMNILYEKNFKQLK